MTSRASAIRYQRRGLLGLLVCAGLLMCTGASLPGSDSRDSTVKVDSIRELEQKTLSLAPPLVEATVGLSVPRMGGAGSGVIVSEDGLILTAGHVVPNPGEEMIVHFSNGKRVRAKALGADKQVDTGLAQITEKGKYPYAKMGKSSALKKGDWVMAIGNPGGYRPDRKPPIRLGRVLALPDKVVGSLWIRTDATVAPGDSGGPLFNMDGEVVGIHSNISPDTTENRHVAVDDYTARWKFMMDSKVTGRMFTNGNGSRPQLGIQPVDYEGKVKIAEVKKDSAAEKAGLQAGDIILSVDGKDVTRADEVFARLRTKRSGNEVKLVVARDGDEKEIKAKLNEGPRTFENPSGELLAFLEKHGYQRSDGVWEYQADDQTKPQYEKLMKDLSDRRLKAISEGALRASKDDFKNSPKVLTALEALTVPVKKSVVQVFNESTKSKGDFEDKPSVLGTIISPDGYILTKASELRDKFYCLVDGKELDGKLVCRRDDFDLALIKVEAKDLQPIKWASQSDPNPGSLTVSLTLDSKEDKKAALGIISVPVREIGSSVAANRAVIGVQFSADLESVKLDSVTKNGPAEKAGIKAGDTLLSIDGVVYKSREEITKALSKMKPGQVIKVEVQRMKDKETEKLKLDVTLGDRAKVFADQPSGRRSDMQTAMFDAAAGVSKRKEDFPEAVTHDSALRNAQMGGPLLNLYGQAIGLNIARFDRTGSYALTYKTLQPIIQKMIEEGKK